MDRSLALVVEGQIQEAQFSQADEQRTREGRALFKRCSLWQNLAIDKFAQRLSQCSLFFCDLKHGSVLPAVQRGCNQDRLGIG